MNKPFLYTVFLLTLCIMTLFIGCEPYYYENPKYSWYKSKYSWKFHYMYLIKAGANLQREKDWLFINEGPRICFFLTGCILGYNIDRQDDYPIVPSFTKNKSILNGAISPDGSFFAVSQGLKSIKIGKRHGHLIFSSVFLDEAEVKWSHDSKKVLFFYRFPEKQDNDLKKANECIVDITNPEEPVVIPLEESLNVVDAYWNNDNDKIALSARLGTSYNPKKVYIFSLKDKEVTNSFGKFPYIDHVEWSPDDSKIALYPRKGYSKKLHIFSLDNDEKIACIRIDSSFSTINSWYDSHSIIINNPKGYIALHDLSQNIEKRICEGKFIRFIKEGWFLFEKDKTIYKAHLSNPQLSMKLFEINYPMSSLSGHGLISPCGNYVLCSETIRSGDVRYYTPSWVTYIIDIRDGNNRIKLGTDKMEK